MNISQVTVEGFRGLRISTRLKRVNIVVGENGVGKTSFLESIFLPTLFQSDLNDNDIRNLLLYMMASRGDTISAIHTLSSSEIRLDDVTTRLKKVDTHTIRIEVNNEKVGEIRLKIWTPLTLAVIKTVNSKYFPIYLSTSFDSSGNLEKIYNIMVRRIGGESVFELSADEYGRFTLYHDKLPVYVMGRGLLKRELIRLALMSSNIILIDEIESSLHPNLVMEVLNDIKREEGVQVIFTTHLNEVVKMAGRVLNDIDAQVIYLSRTGYKTYRLLEISEFEKPLSWLGYV